MSKLLAAMLDAAEAPRPVQVGVLGDIRPLPDVINQAAAMAQRWQEEHRAGTRIALVAHSSTDYLVYVIAGLISGMPVALINPTYPPLLLSRMIGDIAPSLVVLANEIDPAVAGTVAIHPLEEVPQAPQSVLLPEALPRELDIATFMHTSGTTGDPKFCALSHSYLHRLGSCMAAALDLDSDDRVFAPLPMFHINPLGYGFFGAMLAKADALSVSKFSATQFWPAVAANEVTALVLHAPPVEILKRATTDADARGHRVRTMFYADREFMQQFGIRHAVSGYGSTEAAGVTHVRRWSLGDDIPDDASRHGGPARDDIDWRIDATRMIHVHGREPGVLFSGYWNGQGIISALDEQGWFATGDVGRVDEQGELVFVERLAESIRVKGEFVPIPFVEQRLAQLPELKDFALWKRPSDLVDDEVVLYAVCTEVPIDSIRHALADVPRWMQPAAIARVDSIPRDLAAGKVQRRLLHDQEVTSWQDL